MSKAKIIKGLLSLFKEKTSKNKAKRIIASGEDPAELGFAKTVDMGPPRDPGVDYETAAALKKSRKIFDAQQKNLSPLQDELDKMLKAEQKSLDDSLTKLKIATSEMDEMTKVLDEFNRIADEEGIEEALKAFDGLMNPKRTLNAAGGRVGLANGGEPISDLALPMTEEEILERRAAAFKAKDYLRLDPMGSEGYKENLQLQHRFQKPTYAEPYYEFDKDNNRVHPYGLEMADIMQKKMPPVPGLALTKDVDKVIKKDMLDYEKAYKQATSKEFPDIYKRAVKTPYTNPTTLGSYMDDFYTDDGLNLGNRIGINYGDYEDLYKDGDVSMGELIMHEFGHNLFGEEKDSLGYKIAPLPVGREYVADKLASAPELRRNISNVQEEIYDKGGYDTPGEERIARRFTDILTDMIGNRKGEDEEALDRMLEQGNSSYSDHIYGYGKADFEQGLQDMLDAGLEPTENFKKEFLNRNKGGRVGMLSGGLAKGIMQAVQLAKRGVKPFGEKQTYKQNLQNLGLANENALVNNFTNRLDKIMKTRQSQIPEDDLYDLFENIATGKQYDMVSTPIKKDMLAAVMQAMRKRNVDGSDFQNFIADIAPKTKRDILPNDVQSLLKQIDESDAFMEQLRGKPSSKIVPFKPKTKKADGGMVLNDILRSNVSSEEGYEKFLQELGQREREESLVRLQKERDLNQEPSDADKLAMLLAERDMQPKPPGFVSKIFPPKKKKRVGVEGEIKEDFARINYGKPVGEDMFIQGGVQYPYDADPLLELILNKRLDDDLFLNASARKIKDQDPFFGVEVQKTFNQGGLVPPEKGPVSDGMGSLFRRK